VVAREGPAGRTRRPLPSSEGPSITMRGPAVVPRGPPVKTEGPPRRTTGPFARTNGPFPLPRGPLRRAAGTPAAESGALGEAPRAPIHIGAQGAISSGGSLSISGTECARAPPSSCFSAAARVASRLVAARRSRPEERLHAAVELGKRITPPSGHELRPFLQDKVGIVAAAAARLAGEPPRRIRGAPARGGGAHRARVAAVRRPARRPAPRHRRHPRRPGARRVRRGDRRKSTSGA
jgi:hypothetical protein